MASQAAPLPAKVAAPLPRAPLASLQAILYCSQLFNPLANLQRNPQLTTQRASTPRSTESTRIHAIRAIERPGSVGGASLTAHKGASSTIPNPAVLKGSLTENPEAGAVALRGS